ncbi:MAG TPA: VWA domain-containing protein [Blastocatellia bacterium]|nr:VWA domain-containing protein [Blastocatellia bacterium]
MLSRTLGLSLILLIGLAGPLGSAIGQAQPQSRPRLAPAQGQEPAKSQEPVKGQEKPQDQEEAISLGSRLVLVPLSASDATGQPVKDLKAEDVVIEEEGKPQQVVVLGEPGKTPIDIALLFDLSASVHDQFVFQQRAATQFIKDVLKPGDALSIFSIGIVPKMIKERTTNGEEAIASVMQLQPLKEPTAFFDSVVEAATYLEKTAASDSRRVLIVISDGDENYSKKHGLNDALREIQKRDCLFYSINPSGEGIRLNVISLKGQNNLNAMASQTGGLAFNLVRMETLDLVFRQIAQELQAQYLFGYYSSDERRDGGFRRLAVRVPKRSDLRIRTRQGYYAPKG